MSTLLPSVSVTETLKPFSAPVAVERNTKRAPVASVSTVAVMPALAELIMSRTSASDLAGGPTATSIAVAPVLGVNVPPLLVQVPSSMRIVPSPTRSVAAA